MTTVSGSMSSLTVMQSSLSSIRIVVMIQRELPGSLLTNRADMHPPLAATRAVSAFQSLLEDIVGPSGAGLTHCSAR